MKKQGKTNDNNKKTKPATVVPTTCFSASSRRVASVRPASSCSGPGNLPQRGLMRRTGAMWCVWLQHPRAQSQQVPEPCLIAAALSPQQIQLPGAEGFKGLPAERQGCLHCRLCQVPVQMAMTVSWLSKQSDTSWPRQLTMPGSMG